MTNDNSSSKLLKTIYEPVIKAELERAARENSIWLLNDAEQCRLDIIKLIATKPKWFMRKADKQQYRDSLSRALQVMHAYDYLYPRKNFDGTFKIRKSEC